jgi:hypothetical protein
MVQTLSADADCTSTSQKKKKEGEKNVNKKVIVLRGSVDQILI